jgi:hypothetical protein
MKFDPREFDLIARLLRPAPPPPMATWSPTSSRWVWLVETIALACLACYFVVGLAGIFLS